MLEIAVPLNNQTKQKKKKIAYFMTLNCTWNLRQIYLLSISDNCSCYKSSKKLVILETYTKQTHFYFCYVFLDISIA